MQKSNDIIKINFGSGYSVMDGYKTCDITMNPILNYRYDPYNDKIVDCKSNSVDELFVKNVIHHIPDLMAIRDEFYRVLKVGGKLIIVDSNKQNFHINYGLDLIWYRYIIPSTDIWIAEEYRDFINIFEKKFLLIGRKDLTEFLEMIEFIKDGSRKPICFQRMG